jgi:hypothetical protein
VDTSQIPAANERTRVAKQERLISLVNQMQQVQQALIDARSPQDRTMKQRQSDSTSDQIDALVYELYDVSDVAVKRIEETVAKVVVQQTS